MKKCTKCGESKLEEEFHWQNKEKGTRRSTCKFCKSKYSKVRWASGEIKEANYEAKRKRTQAARAYVWNLLAENSCVDCEEGNPLVLEFDHLGGKEYNISLMLVQNFGLATIKKEIAKCDIVCANCHRIRTAIRSNNWRKKALDNSLDPVLE